MRAGWLVVLSFFIGACAARPNANAGAAREPSAEAEMEPLPTDYFALQSACIREWHEVFSEWKRNGGGVKDSIVATRRQIALDRRSRFAALVRHVWAAQPLQQSRANAEFGAWPISLDVSRELGARELAAFESLTLSIGIQEECQTVVWLDGLLWQELVSAKLDESPVRALKETPENMEWTSPYAQQWMSYWLLVRVE